MRELLRIHLGHVVDEVNNLVTVAPLVEDAFLDVVLFAKPYKYYLFRPLVLPVIV